MLLLISSASRPSWLKSENVQPAETEASVVGGDGAAGAVWPAGAAWPVAANEPARAAPVCAFCKLNVPLASAAFGPSNWPENDPVIPERSRYEVDALAPGTTA